MTCPLCGAPLAAEEAFSALSERADELPAEELGATAAARVAAAFWMAIEALESEAQALRALAGPPLGGGVGMDGSAEQAEQDARLLRALGERHVVAGAPGRRYHPVGDALPGAVAAVGRFLIADASLGETLDHIARHAREGIPGTDAVGLTLLDERGRPSTQVYTDPVAPEVDRAQYEDDKGPCLDALRKGITVCVEDTSGVGTRWPAFRSRAVASGITSTLSLPLEAGGERVGVINLYRRSGAYTAADEPGALMFATQAAVVLANARAYRGAVELSEGLRATMETRTTIDLAKGKIMAQTGCSPDEAFALMVKASQREQVKVRDLALRIVEGLPPPEPGP